ncbi:RHS repeat-associated core domain-containing protein [Nitrospira sp. Kam-Ns4a]
MPSGVPPRRRAPARQVGPPCALVLLALAAAAVQAESQPDRLLFGPKQYVRTTGAPNQYTDTFTVPASVGAPFLLHIVNGDTAGGHRLASATITLNGVQVAGPNDFNQNVAVVDRPVTLQPSNTLQVTVASKPGSYLTLSVFGTTIFPTPVSLTPNPLSIMEGAVGTLTATLSPTPTDAGTLAVSSTAPGVASVPASVSFASGQSHVAIPVTAGSEGLAQITVSLNGGTASSTVQVTPRLPTVTSLSPRTLTITQGATGTVFVTISAAQATDTTVALSSTDPAIAFVPSSVTVPAGATAAPVPVIANTPGTAQITASLNETSATSTVTVTPAVPIVISLLPPVTPATLGATVTLTVTISAAQPTDTEVRIEATPGGIVAVPPAVRVPAGATSAPVPVLTVGLGTAMVTASLNGTSAAAAVLVTSPPPAVVALGPSPLTVSVGATGTLTVTVNVAQRTPTEVTLLADRPDLLLVPPTVTVPAGATQAAFAVTGLAVGDTLVTASLPDSRQAALVHIVPPPPAVVALGPSPLTVQQGATGSLTLTLNAAQFDDSVVALSTDAPAVALIPDHVTVPAGQLSAPVPVTGLTPGLATVTATLNGTRVSATVQVTTPPTTVTGLAPTSLTLPLGVPGVLRVTVSPAPPEPTGVALTGSAPEVVTVPPTVTIPAGAFFADFPVLTVGEGTATVTATLNGTRASATVTVIPAELVTLTLSPQTPTAILSETVPFTALGTFTDGSTQDITTRVTWTSSDTTIATITAGGTVSTLAAGTTTIAAASTTPAGRTVTTSTALTVRVPPPLSLSPATASLRVGDTLPFTVSSAEAAPPGGLLVSLAATGSGRVSAPATVLIPEGALSAPFTVTATGAGTVTFTATAPLRHPASSTLTITPGVPTITGFTPTSGPVGTPVTLTGQNFDPTPARNQVRFSGTPAIVSAASVTTLVTTVPQGATSGPVTVTTALGTGTSPSPFTVTLSQNFALSAAPAQAGAIPGGQAAYAVTLSPVGSFTRLVTLAALGLPAGVTAQFSSATVTAGQTALLTLTVGGAVPAGPIAFTVVGTTLLETGQTAQTIPLLLQVLAGGGQTHVSGRFLATDTGAPIPNVQVTLGTLQTQTDAAGAFLLQNVPAGTQKLLISGTLPTGGFLYSTDVVLAAGQPNVLPPFWIMPQPPPERFTPIANGTSDQVFTDPRYPGLSLTLPVGVTIIGWDNVPKTKLALERLDLDRLGVPPPPVPVKSVYQPFFGTPMGGYLSPEGAVIPVSVPNDLGLAPGETAELWVYDATPLNLAEPSGWKKAGLATVSEDGSTIVSNPGVGITRFCFKCGLYTCTCVGNPTCNQPNPNREGDKDNDPVDLGTGLFTAEKTDLVLPGRLPLVLARTFNPLDAYGGVGGLTLSLGFGWVLSVDVTLVALNPAQTAYRLVLPANSRVDLAKQPDGTYVNHTHPFLRGAVLSALPGGDHQLRFKDGTVWRFRPLFTFPAGGTVEFLIAQTDRNGNQLTIERSAGGTISRIVDAAGRALTVTTSAGRITQVQDPLGRTIQYTYGSNGRLATVTDPEQGTTTYTYDASGRITTITDARNILFLQNVYGASGRLVRQVQADGGEWRNRYLLQGATVSGPGCPGPGCPTEESWETVQAGYRFSGGTVLATSVTDPRGTTRTYRFNNLGFTTERQDGLGQKTVLIRGAGNLITASTDALGRTTQFAHDAAGNVTAITDPQGNVTRFAYEPTFNRVTKLTDALGQVTTFTYDAKGNLLTTTDPLGQTTTIGYNAFGQPTVVTDPLGHQTTFTYDADGNLVTTTDPLGNQTLRAYDAVSRLISLTDPRGNQTQFRYDGLNRVSTIADASHGLTRFAYDENGNLLEVRDAKGQRTTYTYDVMDRLAMRTDALGRQETYQYDAAGNLTQFTDRKGQVATFTYDNLNRRTRAEYADGSTTSFIYDAGGRLAAAEDSVGGRIEFTYDARDRLIQAVTPQGTVQYQYDALGRRTQMTANGLPPVTYQYDAASRLTQVAQAGRAGGLAYDAAGRRTGLAYPNGTTTAYGYDNASRLLTILHQGPAGLIESLTYTYDAAGNRTSLTRAGQVATRLPAAVQAAYDAANQQIQFNSAAPNQTFDPNGNLTSHTEPSGTTTYTWDARNRLVGIDGPGVTASFAYDALGRRVRKTVNGVTTEFLYDGNDIVAEIGGGAMATTYLRSLSIDEPFVRQSAGGNEFYHADALGSTLALTGDAGAVTASYRYEPFGMTTATGTSANPFQYTGRENDGAGVYYYRRRYYGSPIHRYLREDPLRLIGGAPNFYVYTENNPLKFVDPYGLYASPWHFILAFYAMISTGHDPVTSTQTAIDSVVLDFVTGSQKPQNANWHSQRRPDQSVDDAVEKSRRFIQQQLDQCRPGFALHIAEDEGIHKYEPYVEIGFNRQFLKHFIHDLFPSPSELTQSFQNDLEIINRYDTCRRKQKCP